MKSEKNPKHIKMKIAHQIQLIFLLSVLLPISILGLFSVFHIRKQMLDHYQSQIHADGIRVNSILFGVTTFTYTATDSIIKNKDCMDLFASSYSTDADYSSYNTIEESLTSFYKYNAAIASVKIYTNNPNIPDNVHISSIDSFQNEDWFQQLPEGKQDHWILLTSMDRWNHELNQLCLIRKIGVTSNRYQAYIVVGMDNNYLRNRLEQTDYQIVISLENSNIFYASDLSRINTPMNFPGSYTGGWYFYNGTIATDSSPFLTEIITSASYMTEDKFYVTIEDHNAYAELNQMTMLYTTMILLAILIPSIIILLFSKYFSNRITTLKQAMHQTSLGDYNIIDTFEGDDELTETFHDLRITVDTIHKKEALYYETKLNDQKLINRQQQMEFNLLASQINPHFLYNTLETIRVQALSCGNRDVASSINLLGKSMHYVLENTGTSSTTLAKELDYIKTYLTIQHLRFGDRVNAIFDISEDCDTESIRILPLLLQPIVENSIIHGLEDLYDSGYITIRIRIQDQLLHIVISDNGVGMDEKTLAHVRQQLTAHTSSDKHSIGLYNIHQRIQLFYGNEYGLRIDSTKDQGTSVSLILPCTTPVETN